MARSRGGKIILWTCREGQSLKNAVEWCARHGLQFDAVNDNLPEMNEIFGANSRKVGADIYIDDKAMNVQYTQKEAAFWDELFENIAGKEVSK